MGDSAGLKLLAQFTSMCCSEGAMTNQLCWQLVSQRWSLDLEETQGFKKERKMLCMVLGHRT